MRREHLDTVLLLALAFSLVMTGAPRADPAKARLGRLAWIALVCAKYADMSRQSNEHARLTDLGMESSRAFADAYFSNQITEQEASDEIPVGAMDVLFGPSKDRNFIAGRLFQSATTHAYDLVIKSDENGKALPADKWIISASRVISIAEDRFRVGNCSLVR